MEEKRVCHKCERSSNNEDIAFCRKTQKHLCKNCCTVSNGGTFKECVDWKFCWPSFYM